MIQDFKSELQLRRSQLFFRAWLASYQNRCTRYAEVFRAFELQRIAKVFEAMVSLQRHQQQSIATMLSVFFTHLNTKRAARTLKMLQFYSKSNQLQRYHASQRVAEYFIRWQRWFVAIKSDRLRAIRSSFQALANIMHERRLIRGWKLRRALNSFSAELKHRSCKAEILQVAVVPKTRLVSAIRMWRRAVQLHVLLLYVCSCVEFKIKVYEIHASEWRVQSHAS
jgi:hypothetical protein